MARREAVLAAVTGELRSACETVLEAHGTDARRFTEARDRLLAFVGYRVGDRAIDRPTGRVVNIVDLVPDGRYLTHVDGSDPRSDVVVGFDELTPLDLEVVVMAGEILDLGKTS